MPSKITQLEAEKRSLDIGIKLIGKYKGNGTNTEFECSKCKRVFITRPETIWRNKITQCNHCDDPKIGEKIGSLLVISIYNNLHNRGGYTIDVICECGEKYTTTKENLLNNKYKCCRACSCILSGETQYKGTKDICLEYFSCLKRNAAKRKIGFDLTIEYIQELLEKQNYICALSGMPISASRNRKRFYSTYQEQTASLDRINSEDNYVVGNVQWVHKDINQMKMTLAENQFIEYCSMVHKYRKLK